MKTDAFLKALRNKPNYVPVFKVVKTVPWAPDFSKGSLCAWVHGGMNLVGESGMVQLCPHSIGAGYVEFHYYRSYRESIPGRSGELVGRPMSGVEWASNAELQG